jgi:ECF transporter S component (folate family)
MRKLKACFKESAAHFKNLRALVLCAMLIGLHMVLTSVRIDLSPQLRVGVGFLTQALTGMLFGPVMGMCSGALSDVLGYLVKPGGSYFPGFTVTAIIGGLIYGLLLYDWRPQQPLHAAEKNEIPRLSRFLRHILKPAGRAFLAKGLINIFCNMLLNTLWLRILYGDAIAVLLPERIIKNLALWPFESLLLFLVAVTVGNAVKRLSGVPLRRHT